MTQRKQWLLYGATGYTGSHIAEKAASLGYRPVLAARSEAKVRPLAERLGLEWRVNDLSDPASLQALVGEFSTVLHAAGPFIDTYRPMSEACLAAGTHYLDINGEIPVYENLAALDTRSRAAGVMLMPGVGFDMVPGDCLALMLKRKMPDATDLVAAVSFEGTLTHGTILSALNQAGDTLVRRDHALTALKAPLTREFDFGPGRCGGRSIAGAITLGDISVGWRTTGIPNITVYQRPVAEFAVLADIKTPADVRKLPAGPSDEELATIPTLFIGEARNAKGEAIAIRLVTPQVYAITASLAAAIAQRVHEGDFRAGYQTPANVLGEDYILGFEGCRMEPWTPGH